MAASPHTSCIFLLVWQMMNLCHFDAFQCDAVDPADVTAIATSVKRALAAYGTPALKEMIQNGMAQDLSWKVSMISAFRKLVPLEKFTRILSRKIQLH